VAFGGFRQTAAAAPMAEINMIPLIDVMLVLLVIFIVTAPLLTHAVKIDLPQASSAPNFTRPTRIDLTVDREGSQLRARLAAASKQQPQPEMHLRADRDTRYQNIAAVMADSASAGMKRIGFLSEPESEPGMR
jgi:biopolymer transport protein ExbD